MLVLRSSYRWANDPWLECSTVRWRLQKAHASNQSQKQKRGKAHGPPPLFLAINRPFGSRTYPHSADCPDETA